MIYLIARVMIVDLYLDACDCNFFTCHGDASVLRLSEKLATCNIFRNHDAARSPYQLAVKFKVT